MPEVLLITNLNKSSPRIRGLIENLPKFDWYPTILTPQITRLSEVGTRDYENWKIVDTPYRNVLGSNRTLGSVSIPWVSSFLGEILNYPCPDKNWLPEAYREGKLLLETGRFSAVISSSAPVVSHLVASCLQREFGLTWIADLRDLWSQNHNYTYSRLRRDRDQKLELQTLAKAKLVTVSEPWAAKLSELHNKPVCTIVSGFGPRRDNSERASEGLTISYTGSIYKGRQNPFMLLHALKTLQDQGKLLDAKVYYCGPNPLPRGFKFLRNLGTLPREVVLSTVQARSELLWIMDWDSEGERGVYPGKLFEYISASRPVISTGGIQGNVVDTFLKDTNTGRHCLTEEDTKEALLDFHSQYKTLGRIPFLPNSSLKNWTQLEMARKFVDQL